MRVPNWETLRRRSVPLLVRALANRHPELLRPVVWDDFVRICQREGITVRVTDLPGSWKARLVRFGTRPYIQIARGLPRDERTVWGMHELAHFWRDDPGVPCYYGDEVSQEPHEEFADIFAWYTTSPARVYLDDQPRKRK